jgi:hypothetical protein
MSKKYTPAERVPSKKAPYAPPDDRGKFFVGNHRTPEPVTGRTLTTAARMAYQLANLTPEPW